VQRFVPLASSSVVTSDTPSIEGARVLVLAGDLFAVEDFATAFEDAGADLAVQTGLIDPQLASLAQVVVLHESLTGTAFRGDVVDFLEGLRERVVTIGAGLTVGFQGLPFDRTAAHPDEAVGAIHDAVTVAPEAPPREVDAPAPEPDLPPQEAILAAARSVPPAEAAELVEVLREETRAAEGESYSRTLRAAMTVLVVTALLWLFFGRGGIFNRLHGPEEGVVPGTPPVEGTAGVPGGSGGAAGAPAGAPAGGGGAPSAPISAAAAGAELAGRVVRADTNGSIGGATVVATGPSGAVATITDGQGRWRFTGLKGGTYTVISTVPRFAAKQVQVEVPEGRTIENVNLSLDPEGT
jgi:hypothetical protein